MKTENCSISVIVPVYNENETLADLHARIGDVMNSIRRSCEIIYVNDGSDDGSGATLTGIRAKDPRVRVLRFRRNVGKASALNAGFRACNGDIVVTLDADLQDDPGEIPRFIEKIEEGFDMVSGWKKDRRDPFEKIIASRIFNLVTARVAKLPLHDFNCGFKAYRKEVVKSLDVYGELHRFLPLLAADKGFRIGEIAVRHFPRLRGHSKYGLRRYPAGLFDLISLHFSLKYAQRPFHFIGAWAFSAFLGGMFLLLYTGVVKYVLGQVGTRPALFVGLFLLGFALNLVISGFIAELIVKTARRDSTPLDCVYEDERS